MNHAFYNNLKILSQICLLCLNERGKRQESRPRGKPSLKVDPISLYFLNRAWNVLFPRNSSESRSDFRGPSC